MYVQFFLITPEEKRSNTVFNIYKIQSKRTFVVIILFSLESDLCRWHWSVFTPVTFVWSDLVHRDAAAVGEGEHDFGDAVVAQPPPGIAVPLVLSLGHHGSDRTQERPVRVYQQSLLLRIALHVHTVGGVRFTEAGETKINLNFYTYLC